MADHLEVAGLLSIVQLAQDRPAELLHHVHEAEPPPCLGVVVGQLGNGGDGPHVVGHPDPDPRSLHLDRDHSTVAHLGPVHLP